MATQAGEHRADRPRVTARTNREAVRLKSEYFAELGLWPSTELNPSGWLGNFTAESDVTMAAHMLNALLFYNNELLAELVRAAIQDSGSTLGKQGGWNWLQSAWEQIVEQSIFSIVTGGTHASDHRHHILRSILDRLLADVPTSPVPFDDVVDALEGQPRAVFLIDDYFGGFSSTDTRAMQLRILCENTKVPVFYCAAIAFHEAATALQVALPDIVLTSPHVLPSKYSVASNDSVVWPGALAAGARDFLRTASHTAGLDATWVDNSVPILCLAFEYRTTDATLPLFLPSPNAEWIPLIASQAHG